MLGNKQASAIERNSRTICSPPPTVYKKAAHRFQVPHGVPDTKTTESKEIERQTVIFLKGGGVIDFVQSREGVDFMNRKLTEKRTSAYLRESTNMFLA